MTSFSVIILQAVSIDSPVIDSALIHQISLEPSGLILAENSKGQFTKVTDQPDWLVPDPMKKPTPEMKQRMCTRKRRYRTQGDALDAALLAGVERQRQAYRCSVCGHWHLTSL